MGVKMYWLIVAAVILLGFILPQEGKEKKQYIIIMAALHTFVCGFRYMYITGDLRKYASIFFRYHDNPGLSWFGEAVFNEGRNAGFEWLMKGFSLLSGGNYQAFLFTLALVAEITLAILIYRYSPKPWLSYLVWNCMSFYVTYDFCAIKQGMAMAVLVVSMMYAIEKKPWHFLFWTLLAGFIHMPALVFLPAYWLIHRRVNERILFMFIVFGTMVFIFRDSIVAVLQEIYYAGNDEVEFVAGADRVGGRFFVIVIIAVAGMLMKGFQERDFAGLFNIVLFAAVLQLFSVYDNVFTRLTDYYLQFTVLFIPLIFYEPCHDTAIDRSAAVAMFPFNERSIRLLVAALTVVLIWWYWRTQLGVTIAFEPDNYLNYRFMWDVTIK